MIAVIESCQLRQALLVRHVKRFAQSLYIRFHLRGKLCLADTADCRVLVEHADVIEIVEFAEDAELREFGDTRDEGKLQIWVKLFQRTVEVLHHEAQLFEIILLMHHVQQRGIIFVYDDHHLLARLLASSLYDTIQSFIRIVFTFSFTIKLFVRQKLQIKIIVQGISIKVLGTAQVEMKHRMPYPFLLIISNGQSLEKFLPSLEIGLEGRGKERLSESSWTTQKDIRHLLFPEIHDVLGLIYIEIAIFADLFKGLNSYRIFIHYFCHTFICFTFCAAKLRIFF